jgi:pimeloyl-ACP methyl ester carboxylesterase
LLIKPVVGKLLASRVSAARVRSALDAVRGSRLADTEFDDLWLGMTRENGHKLWHLLIRYNAERAIHHGRWEAALANWDGPLHLVWGLEDPVSGRHVLEQAVNVLPNATVTELAGVGHFPPSEAHTPSAGTENSRSCMARDSPAGATATASALHLATVPSFVYRSADSA